VNEDLPPADVAPAPEDAPVYASFARRFFASLLDGVIVSVAGSFAGGALGIIMAILGIHSIDPAFAALNLFFQLISLLVSIGYFVYFTGSSGQTLGKMALGIKVIKIETGEAPGYISAFLREAIGKILSSIIFCLGYFWMIWDEKKQTWHDKIAGTIVVRI